MIIKKCTGLALLTLGIWIRRTQNPPDVHAMQEMLRRNTRTYSLMLHSICRALHACQRRPSICLHDATQELGADETVDYTKEDFAQKYKDKPFDVIVDPIGGEVEKKSYTVLAPGGTYAHIYNE